MPLSKYYSGRGKATRRGMVLAPKRRGRPVPRLAPKRRQLGVPLRSLLGRRSRY